MNLSGIMMLLAFPVGPLLFGGYAWWRVRGTRAAPPGAAVPAWPGTLNASLSAALAFNLVYFVQEYFLAWPKSRLPGVDAVVYHNNHGWSGDHPDVLLYQGTGAVAILTLGALLVGVVVLLGRRLRGAYPFVWWSACMALGLGLIQVSIATMHPDNDVGEAFEHLGLSTTARGFIAFLATAAVIAFGAWLARPLLATAPEGALATPRARVLYALEFAIVPLAAGSLIAWANRAPPIGHFTMPLIAGLFVLPWTVVAAALIPAPAPITDRLHRGVDRTLIVASVIVLLVYRLVLAPGLSV